MNVTSKHFVFWTPRILSLAFAAFLGVFALDVLGASYDPWHKALALAMHLIPAAIVLVALAIVWRREWIGAILFPLLAILHLVTKWGTLHWPVYVVIEGTLLLLGALFLVNWRTRVILKRSVR